MDDLRALMEATALVTPVHCSLLDILRIMASEDQDDAALSGSLEVNPDSAMRKTRRHPGTWWILHRSCVEKKTSELHLDGVCKVASAAGFSQFTALTWIVEYLYKLGLESAGGDAYCPAFTEQLYYRLLFLRRLDHKHLVQSLASPCSFADLSSGNNANPTLKGLVDRDVVLFNPNEYLFFGLLGMLEHASGDKSLQKALTNAIAVLPSGGRALENAGFVPDPDYL
jgi:hypothetical protein